MKADSIRFFIVKWSLFSSYYFCLVIAFTHLYGPLVDRIVSFVPYKGLITACKFLLFLLYWVGTYQPWLLIEKKLKDE